MLLSLPVRPCGGTRLDLPVTHRAGSHPPDPPTVSPMCRWLRERGGSRSRACPLRRLATPLSTDPANCHEPPCRQTRRAATWTGSAVQPPVGGDGRRMSGEGLRGPSCCHRGSFPLHVGEAGETAHSARHTRLQGMAGDAIIRGRLQRIRIGRGAGFLPAHRGDGAVARCRDTTTSGGACCEPEVARSGSVRWCRGTARPYAPREGRRFAAHLPVIAARANAMAMPGGSPSPPMVRLRGTSACRSRLARAKAVTSGAWRRSLRLGVPVEASGSGRCTPMPRPGRMASHSGCTGALGRTGGSTGYHLRPHLPSGGTIRRPGMDGRPGRDAATAQGSARWRCGRFPPATAAKEGRRATARPFASVGPCPRCPPRFPAIAGSSLFPVLRRGPSARHAGSRPAGAEQRGRLWRQEEPSAADAMPGRVTAGPEPATSCFCAAASVRAAAG